MKVALLLSRLTCCTMVVARVNALPLLSFAVFMVSLWATCSHVACMLHQPAGPLRIGSLISNGIRMLI